jgi:hypothetical protein
VRVDSAASADTCTYPLGFSGRQTNNNWINCSDGLRPTLMFAWQDGHTGEVGFWTNNSGQMYMAIDGCFYQRRDTTGGSFRVVDTNDLTNYLPLTGGTLTGPLIVASTVYNNFNEGIRI